MVPKNYSEKATSPKKQKQKRTHSGKQQTVVVRVFVKQKEACSVREGVGKVQHINHHQLLHRV